MKIYNDFSLGYFVVIEPAKTIHIHQLNSPLSFVSSPQHFENIHNWE
jgi:hypothetical protein